MTKFLGIIFIPLFSSLDMRNAIVAGQFYPGDKTELEAQINSFLNIKPRNEEIVAAIVPHAGYFFSGKCAGKVYSLLPEAETYVVLGVNHNGLGKDIAISLEDFEIPFGIVKNDIELGKEIIKQLKTTEDKQAHKYEHSIEVQLPFLQSSQKNFKIVPIILKNYNFEICKNLAEKIFQASKKLKRKIVVIASSDFTHAGPGYGFFGDISIDKRAIDEILKFDTEKFMKIAEKTTICGAGAIATTIELAKMLGAKKAKLLEYYDSSRIMPGDNKVGYASIVFL